MNIFKNLNFFNGYVMGFLSIWLVPQRWFESAAIFYYDIVENDDNN